MSKGNYRVCELFNGRFVIEKEIVKTKTTGHLWWRKTTTLTDFKELGPCGNIAVSVDGYRFVKVKTYKTLKKAGNRISTLRRGNKIFLFPS